MYAFVRKRKVYLCSASCKKYVDEEIWCLEFRYVEGIQLNCDIPVYVDTNMDRSLDYLDFENFEINQSQSDSDEIYTAALCMHIHIEVYIIINTIYFIFIYDSMHGQSAYMIREATQLICQ